MAKSKRYDKDLNRVAENIIAQANMSEKGVFASIATRDPRSWGYAARRDNATRTVYRIMEELGYDTDRYTIEKLETIVSYIAIRYR